jgi:hypothetical protein
MKKMWEVVRASQKKFDAILGGNRKLTFGKSGGLLTHDKVLAKEIDDKFGYTKTGSHDVVVTEVKDDHDAIHDPGHKYFFGSMPALPWHKYDKNGKRIE